MENIDTFEIFKYLFGFIVTIGGSYLLFILKSISKDIEQLRELLETKIDTVADNVERHRGDLDDLYNLHRENSTAIVTNAEKLNALRGEFDKCKELQNSRN